MYGMFKKVNGKDLCYIVCTNSVGFTCNMNSDCDILCWLVAREKVVGWYHTGPKLHQNDVAINELIRRYCPNSVLVIIDAKPKDLGLPTEAYQAVEEVHDVRLHMYYLLSVVKKIYMNT